MAMGLILGAIPLAPSHHRLPHIRVGWMDGGERGRQLGIREDAGVI